MSKNLDYYIQILKKVSFDVTLFKKELEKALNFLTPNEQDVLRMWVNEFVSDRQDLQIVISN
ncbi:MAG: hypothetical protein VYD48_01745 [Bacteroidota bacterium]|nr:hypothetical protein [Bacteroidota bacterium]MEC8599523.1 hypothetical protein [Bacteroidota bacterium]